MSNTIQNAIIGGLAVLLLGLGYFLFVKPSSIELEQGAVNPMSEQVLMRTEEFIQHRAELDQVSLSLAVFDDPRFTTLRTYTPALKEQTVGNPELFIYGDTTAGATQ
jgi:hypothetical protein